MTTVEPLSTASLGIEVPDDLMDHAGSSVEIKTDVVVVLGGGSPDDRRDCSRPADRG